MSQPPRFAVRSKILRDLTLSHAAVHLFLFLDDESHGEERLSIRQSGDGGLCAALDMKERQMRTVLKELEDGHYLRIYRTPNGNVYEFHRQKTAGSENEPRQKTAGATGNKLPIHLYRQESIQEPPYPPYDQEQIQPPPQKPDGLEGWAPYEENQPESSPATDPGMCMSCYGRGYKGPASDRSVCGACLGRKCETIRRRA